MDFNIRLNFLSLHVKIRKILEYKSFIHQFVCKIILSQLKNSPNECEKSRGIVGSAERKKPKVQRIESAGRDIRRNKLRGRCEIGRRNYVFAPVARYCLPMFLFFSSLFSVSSSKVVVRVRLIAQGGFAFKTPSYSKKRIAK